MCVIILTSPEHQITKGELQAAWSVNSDGAGLAYIKNGSVEFERGFMNFKHYFKVVNELQGKYELLLHLRISTGAGVTPQGTHPFKTGNVLKMKGRTKQPVIAMNGVITGQKLLSKRGNLLNDTASYIYSHEDAFKVINSDVLEIITQATGSKWAVATPEGLLCSSNFMEYEGRRYSNLNHIYSIWEFITPEPTSQIKLSHLVSKRLFKQLQKDWDLYDQLDDYVWSHCRYYDCKYCNSCLSDCKTKQDCRDFIESNRFIDEKLYLNDEF